MKQLEYIFNFLLMFFAMFLMQFFWTVESNWRNIGILGFALLGYYWNIDKKIPFIRRER